MITSGTITDNFMLYMPSSCKYAIRQGPFTGVPTKLCYPDDIPERDREFYGYHSESKTICKLGDANAYYDIPKKYFAEKFKNLRS